MNGKGGRFCVLGMEPPGPYRRVWTCALFFCDEIGKTEKRPPSYGYVSSSISINSQSEEEKQ